MGVSKSGGESGEGSKKESCSRVGVVIVEFEGANLRSTEPGRAVG